MVVHMEPIVRYGIKARFDSVCVLCGAPTFTRERIYKLPDKRGGRMWACARPAAGRTRSA